MPEERKYKWMCSSKAGCACHQRATDVAGCPMGLAMQIDLPFIRHILLSQDEFVLTSL